MEINSSIRAPSTTIPDLYSQWVESLLNAEIPDEPVSTCMDCAMCSTKAVEATPSDYLFHPSTKCCTVIPKIPNFQTGKILLDQDPSFTIGRLRFQSSFHLYTVVTPLGILPPAADHARQGAMTNDFGRDPDLRCPYYIEEKGGLCGIWKYRNAQCSTWFCKHVRGRTGLYFWRALKDFLQQAEELLAIFCVHELKVGDQDFRNLFPSGDPNLQTFEKQTHFYYSIGQATEEMLRWTWGTWLGQERQFFEECSRIADSFTLEKIINLAGPRQMKSTSFLKSCYSDLTSWKLDEFLRATEFHSAELKSGKVRVWGYSQYDPIDVPRDIFIAIGSFDGVATTRAIQLAHAELTDRWIHDLCDFGILQAC